MFKFTIRELLLLTLVVALGVGWWIEHRRAASLDGELDLWKLRFQLADKLGREGRAASWDYERIGLPRPTKP